MLLPGERICVLGTVTVQEVGTGPDAEVGAYRNSGAARRLSIMAEYVGPA